MKITRGAWQKYITVLRKLNNKATEDMTQRQRALQRAVAAGEISSEDAAQALTDYAYAIATKYGEGAAAASCEMYDAVAELQGARVPLAVPAQTATYGEAAKTVYGVMKQNQDQIPAAVGRLVKQAGVDTTMHNAIRDGAEWAWIPSGDSCAFCMTLASQGWVRASKKVMDGDHASHIHNHCDCTFAVRHDGKSTVEGYDPDALKAQYDAAEGNTPQEKINSMRRAQYAADPEKYRAQSRAAYAKRAERNLPIDEGPFITFAHPRIDGKQQDVIKPRRIMKELGKSESGRRAWRQIKENSINVHLAYNVDVPEGRTGIYDPFDNTITVYVDRTKSIHETTLTVIHEATHAALGGAGTRKEEVRCFIEEARHDKRGETLTYKEIKDIIKKVNNTDAYKHLPWR